MMTKKTIKFQSTLDFHLSTRSSFMQFVTKPFHNLKVRLDDLKDVTVVLQVLD